MGVVGGAAVCAGVVADDAGAVRESIGVGSSNVAVPLGSALAVLLIAAVGVPV